MRKKKLVAEYRAKMKELVEQRADLVVEMQGILDSVKEEKRAMTKEEKESFDELEGKINDIDETISAEERARKIAKHTSKRSYTSRNGTDEEVEVAEARAFCAFIRGNIEELRAGEIQMEQSNNGSIVPTTIANRIVTAVRDMVPFLQLADVIETNGKLSVPVYEEDATNYINADYVAENTDLTDNIGKFTTVDLTGFVIGALALVSNKLLDNTDLDLTTFVVEQVARAIAEKLEKEFINGTSNKITGVISTSNTVAAAATAAITYDEIVSLKHKLKQRFRKKGVFIMHPDTYTAICKLKDANNQPYFKEDEYKILGNAVIESDSMPSVAASAKSIVFADLTGYTIKATKTVEVKLLHEKYSTKNMLGVLAFVEYDGKITDAKKIAALVQAAS